MTEIYLGKAKESHSAYLIKKNFCSLVLYNEPINERSLNKIRRNSPLLQMAFNLLVWLGGYTPAGFKGYGKQRQQVYVLRPLSLTFN